MGSLVRFHDGVAPRIGLLDADQITPIGVGSIAELLGFEVDRALEVARTPVGDSVDASSVRLLPPVDGRTPVWAAGVTYTISRDARVEESESQDVYLKVYDAARPEIFYKAAAHEVVTDGDPVGRRDDSDNDTPEPELGLVLNSSGAVIAYGAVNDMSSRSIEGENPLYLPQAKIYTNSCVIAPTLRLVDEVDDALNLDISMRIERDGVVVFDDHANTGRLHRTLEELAEHLFRGMRFPDGAVLSTGTCLVPPLEEPVRSGDVVDIEVAGIGRMTNVVTSLSDLHP